MTAADIANVQQFVDANLALQRALDLMRLPGPPLPPEMQDPTRPAEADWLPWQPVPGTVSAADIAELEQRTGRRYPRLYLEFLRYQHFGELLPVADITFFDHPIRAWKPLLLRYYYQSWVPENLVGAGYLCFADYSDWGLVCFDTTRPNPDDFDCPVVLIDHELVFTPPVPTKMLYPSFAAMMQALHTAQQQQKIAE